MLLFVGLGNPGPEHAWHRHNVGFMALDAIAQDHGFAPYRQRFSGLVASGRIDGEAVLALKPATYMNESGRSVGAAMRFYKLAPQAVTVLYDELDLPPGKVRVKIGGGAGGHNGIRSIDAHIGKDYRRVRIGIGHPGRKDLVHRYVLHDFAKADQDWLDPLLPAIAGAAGHLVRGDDNGFMNKVTVALSPRPPKDANGAEPRNGALVGFTCGIVGLPNVGKSTLFNALTSSAQAQAANYPFCTIEPNVGRAPVPDPRLDRIVEIVKPARTVPTQLDFVDIAGLVRGASQGEGLGNQFLGHIREVDAIAHVLRCFEDGDITHVGGAIDPIADAETVETELMLADLESLERRREPLVKKARGGDEDAAATLPLIDLALDALRDGRPARALEIDSESTPRFRQLHLLSAKPVLYVCNVDEDSAADGNAHTQAVAARATAEGAGCVVVSAAIEAEIAQLTDAAEREAFLDSLGLEETGLARVIRAGHDLLGLITFFTAGPNEVRAWTLPRGLRAAAAAGRIHTDFERGFICAETISYDDFVSCGGEQAAKDAGKMRTEGRDYVVQDGDVMLFRFNV